MTVVYGEFHPGLVSVVPFSAGLSHVFHLAVSVSSVKITFLPVILPPVVCPKALFLAHYSSS